MRDPTYRSETMQNQETFRGRIHPGHVQFPIHQLLRVNKLG